LFPFRSVVWRAVEFDDELGIDAIEVGDVGTDGMLAAELHAAALAVAEELPEVGFGAGGRLSQAAGELDGILASHEFSLIFALLPSPGGRRAGDEGVRLTRALVYPSAS
jgi:hypothetical protein